jgi:hypothetical protein
MTPDPNFGYEQAAAELLGGVVETVAGRPGQSQEQRLLREQTTVYSVMGFQPRDPVELMLAGHCVIFDHLLRDGARDLLRNHAEDIKLRARPGTLASGKMFLTSLNTLRRWQNRDADKIATLPKALRTAAPDAPAPEPEPVARPLAAAPPPPAAPAAAAAKPRFVCERVHPPRRPEAAHAPRFGAVFRLPTPPRPALPRLDEPTGPATYRGFLRGTVFHRVLPIPQRVSPGAPGEPTDPSGVIAALVFPSGVPVPAPPRRQTAAGTTPVTPADQSGSIDGT